MSLQVNAPSPRRGIIWSHLVVFPGLTAGEIGRAALRLTGPTTAHMQTGSVLQLLRRMERDGQVTSCEEYRAEQGRAVSVWHAVPGALTIPDGGGA